MQASAKAQDRPRLVLTAKTAADLMTPNPVSLRGEATVQEAIGFLTDQGFSGAAVLDETGRPIGVLSRADIVVHDREKIKYVRPLSAHYERTHSALHSREHVRSGFQVVDVDRTRVRDIMTPVVYSVTPETSAGRVVAEMLTLMVHRLFVVGDDGLLVGVISALDVLRHLHPERPEAIGIPPEAPPGTASLA